MQNNREVVRSSSIVISYAEHKHAANVVLCCNCSCFGACVLLAIDFVLQQQLVVFSFTR